MTLRGGAYLVSLMMLVGCGDNHPGVLSDAANTPIDAGVDAAMDASGTMVRVFGHVEALGEPVPFANVVTLEGVPRSTTTDMNGDFFFDAIEGSRLIVRVLGFTTRHSMIRGVIAADHLRPRVFYLLVDDEIAAAEAALGVTFDSSTAIVEVDFRNAEIGGYGAALATPANVPITPTFGVVIDGNGQPQINEQTVAGGDGSTLLLAGISADATTFTPILPPEATLPCQPRDANPLPLLPDTVTWFDYECGNGTD